MKLCRAVTGEGVPPKGTPPGVLCMNASTPRGDGEHAELLRSSWQLGLELSGEAGDPGLSPELTFAAWEQDTAVLLYQVNNFKVWGIFVVFSQVC